jgi:hypothetical protein
MPDDLTERILEDMEKQGFPIEVRVTEMLKTLGWGVSTKRPTSTGKKANIEQ